MSRGRARLPLLNACARKAHAVSRLVSTAWREERGPRDRIAYAATRARSLRSRYARSVPAHATILLVRVCPRTRVWLRDETPRISIFQTQPSKVRAARSYYHSANIARALRARSVYFLFRFFLSFSYFYFYFPRDTRASRGSQPSRVPEYRCNGIS